MEEPLSINEQTLLEQLESAQEEDAGCFTGPKKPYDHNQKYGPIPGKPFPPFSDEEMKGLKEALERKNRKWDEGKLKYRLILPGFLELMAEILTRGEINHPCEPDGTPSWQLVEPVAYEDALFRHFQAYRKGEIIDTDLTMPTDHMGNIAVDAMFLWWFNQQKEKV